MHVKELAHEELAAIARQRHPSYTEGFYRFSQLHYGMKAMTLGVYEGPDLLMAFPVSVRKAASWLPIAEIPLSIYYTEPIIPADRPIDFGIIAPALMRYLNVSMIKTQFLQRSAGAYGLQQSPSSYVAHIADVGPIANQELFFKTKINHKARNQIRASHKHGFEFRACDSSSLEEFYRLYSQHHQARGYYVRPYHYFEHLSQAFGSSLHILTTWHQHQLVAANLCVIEDDYLWLLQNVFDHQLLNHYVNNFMYWQMLCWGMTQGIRYFDYGGTDATDHGVIHFKEAMGGTAYTIVHQMYFKNYYHRMRYWWQKRSHHIHMRFQKWRHTLKPYDNLDIYERSVAVQSFDKEHLFPAEEVLFNRYVKPGMKILDLGCGTGRTTTWLAKNTDEVIGTDYAEAMITRAHEKYPALDFRVMDARQIKFPNNSFDAVVFSFNGLDYPFPKSERLKVFREIRRVLRPGGIFIYSSHNRQRLPIGRRRLRDWFGNLITGRLFSWYRLDHQQFGPLVTYFGSIHSERKDLTRHGFELLDIQGNHHQHRFAIKFLESYIYYAARKRSNLE